MKEVVGAGRVRVGVLGAGAMFQDVQASGGTQKPTSIMAGAVSEMQLFAQSSLAVTTNPVTRL